MVCKIGYCPWFIKDNLTQNSTMFNYTWVEQAYFELEKVDTWNESTSRFKECPAFLAYVNNTFVLRSLIDLELTWDKTNQILSSNLPQPQHDLMVRVHYNDFDIQKDNPIVAISSAFVFVADKPVYVEFLPPFNDIDPTWRLVPGSFNINSWTRPVLPTVELLSDKITIKRGQPLSYIRFRSENLRENFSLERIPRTSELENAVDGCLSVKNFAPNLSWKIHNSKINPARWFKK